MNKALRRICITALALCFALLSFGMAFADEDGDNIDYTGYLDPATNEPIAESETGAGTGRDTLNSTMFYDRDTKDFVFSVSGTLLEVHSNAADGMILNVPVYVTGAEGGSATVYQNGNEYGGSLTSINQPGEYVVTLQQNGSKQRLFTFRIVGEATGLIHSYTVPDGFYLTKATRDGENILIDRYTVNMEEEGDYSIEYECSSNNVIYTLKTTIDRTPPRPIFSGSADSGGRIHSAVKISGLESSDTLVVYRNGGRATVSRNSDGSYTLPDTGTYYIQVYDEAGNVAEYNFTIAMYLNSSAFIFVILMVIVIAAVAGYIIHKRRHLRIG